LPIYEYECAGCGAVTDIRHGFHETPDQPCATCGGALKRIFRPAGIVFKGSGFYVTDSRKSSSAAGEGPKQDAAPKAGDSGTKADAKKPDSGGTGDAAA
jgi:putative FmdB family regulatory protein